MSTFTLYENLKSDVSAEVLITIDFSTMSTVTKNRLRRVLQTVNNANGWSSKTTQITNTFNHIMETVRGDIPMYMAKVLPEGELEQLEAEAMLVGANPWGMISKHFSPASPRPWDEEKYKANIAATKAFRERRILPLHEKYPAAEYLSPEQKQFRQAMLAALEAGEKFQFTRPM